MQGRATQDETAPIFGKGRHSAGWMAYFETHARLSLQMSMASTCLAALALLAATITTGVAAIQMPITPATTKVAGSIRLATAICAVAFLSYMLILRTGARHTETASTEVMAKLFLQYRVASVRFMDWIVTMPLLVVEAYRFASSDWSRGGTHVPIDGLLGERAFEVLLAVCGLLIVAPAAVEHIVFGSTFCSPSKDESRMFYILSLILGAAALAASTVFIFVRAANNTTLTNPQLSILIFFCGIVWWLYPVVYLVCAPCPLVPMRPYGSGMDPPEQMLARAETQHAVFAILDILSKAVFSIAICWIAFTVL